ncbi:ferritin-like domain-containing protein [Methyloprofundus sp.]|uniref:ferritin-like domain-containing protein n=1 Tax=Methyloprofundus sp. TaxID=2020875 RepID=UPI003D0B908F
MNNVFDFAEACLHRADIEEKLQLTAKAWQLYQQGELKFDSLSAVQEIEQVCFPDKPELLAPRYMARRKLGTPEGVQAFYHALAHIEFIAIYLAWDILYRFRGLPEKFYQDWLRVAYEEALHFELIRSHLRKLGIDYGDLPAHQGLWEHAQDTAHDLLARLTIIPRCMEARGLDVTPGMIDKIRTLKDEAGVKILQRILQDEQQHVLFGSEWFNQQCREQQLEPEATFKAMLLKYFNNNKPKGPFNNEMRLNAGFTANELAWLNEQ